MTNKFNSAKKPRLRCVDISLDLQEENEDYIRKNDKKGSKKYPLSIHSFEKGSDYQQKLVEDIDRLFAEEILSVHGSPSWILEVNKETSHSGEFPLFLHRFLSPCKSAQTREGTARPSTAVEKSTEEPKDKLYYRPNRTHQYLTSTDVKDQCLEEVNLKYGRPTRTTLLRARQRSNTPTVNAYDQRKEEKKRSEKIARVSSMLMSARDPPAFRHDGESIHSFLTGARYNGAHCVDTRSLALYGIYMPRTNPTKYFVNGMKQKDTETPSAPPDSPRSDIDARLQATFQRRPMTAPNYGRQSRIHPARKSHQAWMKESQDVQERDSVCDDDSANKEDRKPSVSPNACHIHLNLSSLKSGIGQTSPILPRVQGVSLSKISKQLSQRDVIVASYSPPSSPAHTSQKHEKKISSSRAPLKPALKKPTPVMVDRSVKAPSVDTEGNVTSRNIERECHNIVDIVEDEELFVKGEGAVDRDDAIIDEVARSTSANRDYSEGTVRSNNSQTITIPSDKNDGGNIANEDASKELENDDTRIPFPAPELSKDGSKTPSPVPEIENNMAGFEDTQVDDVQIEEISEQCENCDIKNNDTTAWVEGGDTRNETEMNSPILDEPDFPEEHKVIDVEITSKSHEVNDIQNTLNESGSDVDIKIDSAIDQSSNISDVLNVSTEQS